MFHSGILSKINNSDKKDSFRNYSLLSYTGDFARSISSYPEALPSAMPSFSHFILSNLTDTTLHAVSLHAGKKTPKIKWRCIINECTSIILLY